MLDVQPTKDLDEFRDAFLAIGQYFGAEPTDEFLDGFVKNLPLERMHGARENGRVVGGAGAFPLTMTVPGGEVACAGVTLVGVHPTHRRRGVLRAMMRAQLDDVRERGEPIAALWASEEAIYTRFGYGLASIQGEITLARERSSFALPFEPAGTIELVDTDAAAAPFRAVHEAWRRATPGAFRREDAWWKYRSLADRPESRDGAGPKRLALLERDGDAVGYAVYRHKFGFAEGASTGELRVIEAIGVDARAMAQIWRYLLDIDWNATIKAYLLPRDHPLFLLLMEPRRLRYRAGDGLWVRIVDLAAALSSRTYAEDGAVVFDVTDEFIPENAGRWKLEGGTATRTDDHAELALDVRELGSAYLGGFTFAELARALRVRELVPGALSRADAIFRTDVHPWCPEIF